ncbi:MAG: hypothetical protein LBI79_07570, partial [Nitrososphaerota archaeon]|nr:hypothetical protein [Nitrososphaerota archaeon]
MNKKTQKSIVSVMLLVVLVVGCFTIIPPTSAANNGNNSNSGNGNGNATVANKQTTIYLKGSGSNFNMAGWQNIFYVGDAESNADPSVWHLVYSGKIFNAITYMQITFTNGEVFEWTPDMGPSVNGGNNNMGWVIVAPADWEIAYVNKGNNNDSGSYLITEESSNPQFNISGFHKGTPDPKFGSLEVTVNVDKRHKVIVLQDVYQGTTQDVYQGTIKNTYIPIFERKVITSGTGTVTSFLGDNTGGRFNNGMVWFAIDVEKAKTDGYTFGIAYSNPANTHLGYYYNIAIVNNQLVLSFDDRFISALEATAKVYNAPPSSHDNSGHTRLNAGQTITVNLPAGHSDTVYLYVHFNTVSWYSVEYSFTGQWRLVHTDVTDPVYLRTDVTDPVYLRTDVTDPVYLRTDVTDPVYL